MVFPVRGEEPSTGSPRG